MPSHFPYSRLSITALLSGLDPFLFFTQPACVNSCFLLSSPIPLANTAKGTTFRMTAKQSPFFTSTTTTTKISTNTRLTTFKHITAHSQPTTTSNLSNCSQTYNRLTDHGYLFTRTGWKQSLDRSLSAFGTFGVTFSCLSVLAGLTPLYGDALQSGGPVAVIWGMPTLFFHATLLALTSSYLCRTKEAPLNRSATPNCTSIGLKDTKQIHKH